MGSTETWRSYRQTAGASPYYPCVHFILPHSFFGERFQTAFTCRQQIDAIINASLRLLAVRLVLHCMGCSTVLAPVGALLKTSNL